MDKPAKVKKRCPMVEGFCTAGLCAWWTGTMCAVMGVGVILEQFLRQFFGEDEWKKPDTISS